MSSTVDEIDYSLASSISDEHRAHYVTAPAWSRPEDLYEATVCVSGEYAKDIEVETRDKSSCQRWFTERHK